MRLTILGSGTAAPLLDRNCAGYIIEAGGRKLLFDSGPGTIRRLLELRYDLFEIGEIFYTHLHNDHINDLGAIIWSSNYGGIRKKPLNLYGPYGFKQYYNTLVKKLLKPTKINFKVNAREFKKSIIKIKNTTISTDEIRHSSTTKSIAYRIKHKNKALVYAGDAEYCSEVIKIAKNADALLIECSLPDNKKME
ncbi:ribonuclease Z, partial [Candidatus Woesearchaeota archaeon]|nr:ribonuclease Z [Candidatus Woesearchaeota archaeon]